MIRKVIISKKATVSTHSESESFDNSVWVYAPELVLLKIVGYLEVKDIIALNQCCKRWNAVLKDESIWRKLFYRDFGLPLNKKVGLKPGAESWFSEYQRLTYHVPMVLSDSLTGHSHQVLHVSFSHNGKLFCTCSKDGQVIVWNSAYPSTKKYSYDMKIWCWKYTQFSQFNTSDTLLLVSGVHFGTMNSTSGEIAVFGLADKLKLRCRIKNRPYDIFGTWFTDRYLLSGDLNWLQHLISSSDIWLNKASQEITSENIPIMSKLFKFYNRNASSVRSIMVADCPWLNDPEVMKAAENERPRRERNPVDLSSIQPTPDEHCTGNPISQAVLEGEAGNSEEPYGAEQYWGEHHYASTFQYSDEFRRKFSAGDMEVDDNDDDSSSDEWTEEEIEVEIDTEEVKPIDLSCQSTSQEPTPNKSHKTEVSSKLSSKVASKASSVSANKKLPQPPAPKPEPDYESMEYDDLDDLENAPPKYLIFSTGSKAYVPHQVAFKRVENVSFPKTLDPGPSIKERIAMRAQRRESESNGGGGDETDWSNYKEVADRFDKVDKVIDLHGQIIGMALSPDHRFLYVNCRPWPQNYVIRNPLEPPPIAQEIDIHVIDLVTFRKVGKMLRAHRAYTPNSDCFFIFLDVCDKYVASGAEDMHAYLWDRYYGMCLAKYNHRDVVNSVAFNPKDNEMLVTTSDDYELKIWRSRAQVKSMNVTPMGTATKFKPRSRQY